MPRVPLRFGGIRQEIPIMELGTNRYLASGKVRAEILETGKKADEDVCHLCTCGRKSHVNECLSRETFRFRWFEPSIEAHKWGHFQKNSPSCLENVALSGICEFITASQRAEKRWGKPSVVSQTPRRRPRRLRGRSESSACSSSICTRCGKSSFGSMETGMRPPILLVWPRRRGGLSEASPPFIKCPLAALKECLCRKR